MYNITYGQVKHVLAELGFREAPAHGEHLLYVHPEATRAKIMVPKTSDEEQVYPAFWLGIRRAIFEYGIIGDPSEMDERVYADRG